jgi:16S rRNA G966 N2-methylase RsmD
MNDIITDHKILRKLFPNANKYIINNLLIDNESKMYISTNETANKISNIIKTKLLEYNLLSLNLTITDATAGVGGNVLSFSKYFSTVNAIELNNIRCKYLVNNINCYEYTNISIFNANCLDIIFNLEKQDVIFCDPPWGGHGYKDNKNLRLTLENNIGIYNLEDVCNKLLDVQFTKSPPKLIILKLPKNYDITYLMNTIKSNKIFIHVLKKMFIISIVNI